MLCVLESDMLEKLNVFQANMFVCFINIVNDSMGYMSTKYCNVSEWKYPCYEILLNDKSCHL